MLIELYGRNFGCFRDEFRLSMLATEIDPDSNRGVVEVKVEGDEEPLRLLRAVALYGPNASGKSTVLRAAGALGTLLAVTPRLSSDSRLTPYEPFALRPLLGAPVELGAKVVVDGRVYDYAIAYDSEAFLSERLGRARPDGSYERLIDRRGQNVDGAWADDPQFKLFSGDFRPNALLLSLADSLAPGLAKDIAVGLRRLLRHSDPFSSPFLGLFNPLVVAQRTREDEAFREWLLERLRMADVGVVGVRQEELKPEPDADIFEFLQLRAFEAEDSDEGVPARKGKRTPYRLTLVHESDSGLIPMPYKSESLGTKRLVEWAPLIYDLTHSVTPRAAFVDELDASMHPVLLRAIVEYVNSNDSGLGQLIFTTHETTLLDDEAKNAVLRRDQIYLTEKDATGASRLYSVAEFRERNNLNIRRRYLQGRYGALPAVGRFAE